MLSAELSTVSVAAETLIEVGNLVVHIDLESGPDDELARRMLLYNVLAHHHTKLPVRSIVVPLRSNAVGRGPAAQECRDQGGREELGVGCFVFSDRGVSSR